MNDVKQKRLEKGLTLKEVAIYLELPILVYFYYETICGVEKMHYDILMDLCDLLGLNYHNF